MVVFLTPRRSNVACATVSIQVVTSATSTATARTKMGTETMAQGKVPDLRLGPATHRAPQLDALAAVLPMGPARPAPGAPYIERASAQGFASRRGHASARTSGSSLGCLGSVDRHLRDGSSSRYPGSCGPSLGFSSGGHRRSEVARLRVEQLRGAPPTRLDPRDRNRPRNRASQPISAGPRRATPTRRAGRSWSIVRSRPCTNGWSGPASRRGRCSERSMKGSHRG